jgi:hypothetical protein
VCCDFRVEKKGEQALNKLETMKEVSILFSGCSNSGVVRYGSEALIKPSMQYCGGKRKW